MRISGAMNYRVFSLWIFLSFRLFFSDVCTADIPPFKQIREANMLEDLEKHATFTSYESSTRLDDTGDVPIVNPSTPGSGMSPPFMNPPMMDPPFMNPPSTESPFLNPPTTNPPYMNPPATTSPNVNPSPPATTEPLTNPTPTTTSPTSSSGSWCIANPSASQTSLQVALDYACGYGGTDCSQIQPGATCFEPNTLKDHASFAFNDYYHKNPAPTSCAFGGAAQLTNTDPSHGNCRFSSSTGASPTPPMMTPPMMTPPMMTPPMTTSPSPPSPPSITPPINPYTPGGPTGYGSEPTDFGAEPTETPSAGMSISYHQSLLSPMTCFMLLLVACSYT